MQKRYTINELRQLHESEDKVEFKEAKRNFPFAGGERREPKERRKCFLGYVVALCNEGGGHLVLGMKDKTPHEVVGSDFSIDKIGELENEVYERLHIRIHCEELFENNKRILVTHIPTRPIGRLMKFESVPLMRTGDSLRDMNDQETLAVLSEEEPDYSAKICNGFRLDEIDEKAFNAMKKAYAGKQGNLDFIQLSKQQIVTDLDLSRNGKLTYAALILLGNGEKIKELLPQSKIIWEYRAKVSQIAYDQRREINGPLFLTINEAWDLINQPALNTNTPIQNGPFIHDVFDFNEEVLREALLNAVAHRDYSTQSEVVIKQYPDRIILTNPGGFPKGVTVENILTVNSTPRCRLMTDVMQKTGLVERSGQGVDKIFSRTISEGKPSPNYNESDAFQVKLILYSEVKHPAFHIFIQQYQLSDKEPKLGVEQIITLCQIRDGYFEAANPTFVDQLLQIGLIKRISSAANKYELSQEYLDLAEHSKKIGKRYLKAEVSSLLMAMQNKPVGMAHLKRVFDGRLKRTQLRYLLLKLIEDRVVVQIGQKKGTKYGLASGYENLRGKQLIQLVFEDLDLSLGV